jgi:hypothetical protein
MSHSFFYNLSPITLHITKESSRERSDNDNIMQSNRRKSIMKKYSSEWGERSEPILFYIFDYYLLIKEREKYKGFSIKTVYNGIIW